MNNMKTNKELAEEYRESAKKIEKRLQELENQSREERNKSNADQRIAILNAEYLHMLRLANHLDGKRDGNTYEMWVEKQNISHYGSYNLSYTF